MEDVFYFIAQLPRAAMPTLTVIDLSYACAYERDEFRAINNTDYTSLDQAIQDARKLAAQEGMAYQRFESRYHDSLNEALTVKMCDRQDALDKISETLPTLQPGVLVKLFIKVTGSLYIPDSQHEIVSLMMDSLNNEPDNLLTYYMLKLTGESMFIG